MDDVPNRGRGGGMSAGESFADWLSVIVVSDDPANGGAGLLVLSDCAKCDGHGIVERSHRSGMRLEPCPVCVEPKPHLTCPCASCTCGDPATGKGTR